MKIITLDEIKNSLTSVDIIHTIEQAFIAYSNNKVVTAPVGELIFKNPPGDVHIKYGYIIHDDYYVVKIASGFYDNPKLNLPSSNGLMFLFSQKTGETVSILLDEGYLTDIRTAAAGAIAAKYLAPSSVKNIGIVGTGIQAKLQLLFLKKVTNCRSVIVCGRNEENLKKFQTELEKKSGFKIQITHDIENVTSRCNLIVTTTPSTIPLIFEKQIKNGTHITAIGADSSYKQELDSALFKSANIIVADSISQCVERGDIAHAIKDHVINKTHIVELGNIISGKNHGRTSDNQITITDLTGLAVQDIAIAKMVYLAVK